MTWTDVTFVRDFEKAGVDTQYHGPDGEPLADPIPHPYPMAFRAGTTSPAGVADNGDGTYSLEFESEGGYGSVWLHGVPADHITFPGKS